MVTMQHSQKVFLIDMNEDFYSIPL